MKRKINTRIYQLYFEDKGRIDRTSIHILLNNRFPNYTFASASCMWHGKREETLIVTILDDNKIGHRKTMALIKDVVAKYNRVHIDNRSTEMPSEVLVTVTKAQAYFVNGEAI